MPIVCTCQGAHPQKGGHGHWKRRRLSTEERWTLWHKGKNSRKEPNGVLFRLPHASTRKWQELSLLPVLTDNSLTVHQQEFPFQPHIVCRLHRLRFKVYIDTLWEHDSPFCKNCIDILFYSIDKSYKPPIFIVLFLWANKIFHVYRLTEL